jgi:hypothetical protein
MTGKIPTLKEPDSGAPESVEIPKQHVCVSCGAKSPMTETNYTLISPRHGWRLTRGTDAAGRKRRSGAVLRAGPRTARRRRADRAKDRARGARNIRARGSVVAPNSLLAFRLARPRAALLCSRDRSTEMLVIEGVSDFLPHDYRLRSRGIELCPKGALAHRASAPHSIRPDDESSPCELGRTLRRAESSCRQTAGAQAR